MKSADIQVQLEISQMLSCQARVQRKSERKVPKKNRNNNRERKQWKEEQVAFLQTKKEKPEREKQNEHLNTFWRIPICMWIHFIWKKRDVGC